jgi:hypothetical protein
MNNRGWVILIFIGKQIFRSLNSLFRNKQCISKNCLWYIYCTYFWRRSQFSVQYWTFFGTSIFGYIFFVFWSASKKNYKFEINVKNVFLKCFHISKYVFDLYCIVEISLELTKKKILQLKMLVPYKCPIVSFLTSNVIKI